MITYDLPFADYLAIDAVHHSTLKEIDLSPKHYAHAKRTARKDTPALVIGRVVHAMILDPQPPDVVVYEGKTRRGKAWEEFQAAHPGKLILRRKELEDCTAMRAAILAHPPAAALFAEGRGEVSLQWQQQGMHCKCRLDWLCPDGAFVDLKSTWKIRPRSFAQSAAAFSYHTQFAFYDDGVSAVTGTDDRPAPWLVAVEKKPPYDVAVYRITQETLDIGRRKVDEWLRKLAEARNTGQWPGVVPHVQDFELPDYMAADGLGDIDFGETEGEGADDE